MEIFLLIVFIIVLIIIMLETNFEDEEQNTAVNKSNSVQSQSDSIINIDTNIHNNFDDIISIVDELKTSEDYEQALKLATPGMTAKRREDVLKYNMKKYNCDRLEAIKLELRNLGR